ncbi:unnamed protein product [Phaeothamnion confervicola]
MGIAARDSDDNEAGAALSGPLRFCTSEDVALHNSANDCWISCLGRVYDLSALITENRGPLADPLIMAAGSDISAWFSPATGDPKTAIHPETGLRVAYTPMGRFLHVPPPFPSASWSPDFGQPWWRDDSLVVAKLTKRPRRLRVVNMLSGHEDELTVASEDTIADIRTRYLERNAHALSYTWKALRGEAFVCVDMDKTLLDNRLYEAEPAAGSSWMPYCDDDDDDAYVPVLHLYYNDDGSIA